MYEKVDSPRTRSANCTRTSTSQPRRRNSPPWVTFRAEPLLAAFRSVLEGWNNGQSLMYESTAARSSEIAVG